MPGDGRCLDTVADEIFAAPPTSGHAVARFAHGRASRRRLATALISPQRDARPMAYGAAHASRRR